jgi:hypothetical protein
MGNGALPNGPSYRAHPRLYLLRHGRTASECPLLVEEQTRTDLTATTTEFDSNRNPSRDEDARLSR